MNNEKIIFEENKILVKRSAIANELLGKLSSEDIKIGEKLINNERDKRQLLIKMLGNESCSCKDVTANSYSANKCLPRGNDSSEIMFVKKKPSLLETRTMMSHSDSDGYFLSLVLHKLGYNPNNFYYTDFVKCSEVMNSESIWNCAISYFMREVNVIKPKIIILQGLSLLKMLKASECFYDIPEQLDYGVVYDSYFLSKKQPIKIVAIYDIESMIKKDDKDLQHYKNILWRHLSTVMNIE